MSDKELAPESFNPPIALTFDDVLLRPQYSDIPSRSQVDISSSLTPDIRLSLPIISANMNSVTESKTAIAMALGTDSGISAAGMGFIHRFNSIEQQVAEIEKVKRFRSYIIEKPYVIKPDKTIADAEALMDYHNIGGLMVVGDNWLLIGIITRRDIYAEAADTFVREAMTPRDEMVVAPYKEMQKREKAEKARALMHQARIEKLPLINSKDQPVGLIVMKDIRKLEDFPKASINEKGQLIVGAAVGVVGDHLERAQALIDAGVDVLVSDVAHAHHNMVKDSILEMQKLSDLPIIAGTISGRDSYRFLAEMGRDWRKSGKEGGVLGVACGVGSGCFEAGTRVLMGNGAYKNIESIVAGDKVINKDGVPVKVNKAWMTGMKPVIKVNHSHSADSTFVTSDHRYWVKEKMPVLAGPDIESKSTSAQWQSISTAENSDLTLPSKMKFELPREYIEGEHTVKYPGYGMGLDAGDEFRMGVFAGENIFMDSKDYLLGVFDGLTGGEDYIETENKEVLEVFSILSQMLHDVFPKQQKTEKNGRTIYFASIEGFETSEEQEVDLNYIQSAGEELVPVYDIEVDCPTHSFIADNAIVHNSICSTRLVSGHGMPQLQALSECYHEQQANFKEVSIIADGGMQKPADIDKALVFADAVKLGSMLAGTPEAPGEILRDPNTGQQMKMYRGMASKEAFEQKLQAEGVSDLTARSVNYNPEGVSAQIPLKPPVKELLSRLAGSLRSCLSYSGSRTIEEFKEKAEFVRITDSGVSESDTHIYNQYS